MSRARRTSSPRSRPGCRAIYSTTLVRTRSATDRSSSRARSFNALACPSVSCICILITSASHHFLHHDVMMSGRGAVVNASRQPGGRRPAEEKEQGAVLVVAGSAGRWPAFRAAGRGSPGMRASGPRSQGSHAAPTTLPRSRWCGPRTRRHRCRKTARNQSPAPGIPNRSPPPPRSTGQAAPRHHGGATRRASSRPAAPSPHRPCRAW